MNRKRFVALLLALLVLVSLCSCGDDERSKSKEPEDTEHGIRDMSASLVDASGFGKIEETLETSEYPLSATVALPGKPVMSFDIFEDGTLTVRHENGNVAVFCPEYLRTKGVLKVTSGAAAPAVFVPFSSVISPFTNTFGASAITYAELKPAAEKATEQLLENGSLAFAAVLENLFSRSGGDIRRLFSKEAAVEYLSAFLNSVSKKGYVMSGTSDEKKTISVQLTNIANHTSDAESAFEAVLPYSGHDLNVERCFEALRAMASSTEKEIMMDEGDTFIRPNVDFLEFCSKPGKELSVTGYRQNDIEDGEDWFSWLTEVEAADKAAEEENYSNASLSVLFKKAFPSKMDKVFRIEFGEGEKIVFRKGDTETEYAFFAKDGKVQLRDTSGNVIFSLETSADVTDYRQFANTAVTEEEAENADNLHHDEVKLPGDLAEYAQKAIASPEVLEEVKSFAGENGLAVFSICVKSGNLFYAGGPYPEPGKLLGKEMKRVSGDAIGSYRVLSDKYAAGYAMQIEIDTVAMTAVTKWVQATD